MVNIWNFPGAYPTIAMTTIVVSSAVWMSIRTVMNSPDIVLFKKYRDEMYDTPDAYRRGELFKKYSPYRFMSSLISFRQK